MFLTNIIENQSEMIKIMYIIIEERLREKNGNCRSTGSADGLSYTGHSTKPKRTGQSKNK